MVKVVNGETESTVGEQSRFCVSGREIFYGVVSFMVFLGLGGGFLKFWWDRLI